MTLQSFSRDDVIRIWMHEDDYFSTIVIQSRRYPLTARNKKRKGKSEKTLSIKPPTHLSTEHHTFFCNPTHIYFGTIFHVAITLDANHVEKHISFRQQFTPVVTIAMGLNERHSCDFHRSSLVARGLCNVDRFISRIGFAV